MRKKGSPKVNLFYESALWGFGVFAEISVSSYSTRFIHLSALLFSLFTYLRPSLASMHSVAWGTFIRRSLGISLPVVLQMP